MGALSPPLRTSPKLRSVPLTHSLSGASPAPPSPRAHRSSQSVRQVPRKVLIRAGIAVVVLIVIALLSLRADGVEGVRRRLLGLSVEKPSPEENTIVDLERDLRITAYDGGAC
jgi:hypothetical protein